MHYTIFLLCVVCIFCENANYQKYESCNNQTNDALDAYGRAADLDPNNVHIKARLQLLQSGQVASQGNAPIPQDVHPQQYQAAGVGVPPNPHWVAPPAPSGGPPQGPHPPSRIAEWSRGINEVPVHQPPPPPPPQGPGPFDHRDVGRGAAHQHPSPQQEAGRQFPEPPRQAPGRKALSPSPKFGIAAPNSYQAAQTLPQLGSQAAQPLDRPPTNASFGPSGRHPPFMQSAGLGPTHPSNGPPTAGSLPPYGRPFTPPTEIRPIRDERPISPGHGYPPHPQYHHGPIMPVQGGGIASGAPPPASAMSAAEAAARERDDRPPSSMKRAREWESEHAPVKKLANEETRARLEDQATRRPSPSRISSPRDLRRRRSSSDVRREDQRRAHDNYHPSEAAHHPPTLPSIQHMGQQQPQQGAGMPPISDIPSSLQGGPLPGMQPGHVAGVPGQTKEERDRREVGPPQHEPPARKMEVDEDYDDEGDEEKKASAPHKGSPNGASGNGLANGNNQSAQPKVEPS